MSDSFSKRYPIGQFEYGKTYSLDQTKKNIAFLKGFPKKLRKVLRKATSLELETPYRKGGWTVRQVAHHLADSHINAYIRMKMAVTEIVPVVKPYEEDQWAELEDGKEAPLKPSLSLLKALHQRWVRFMESLSSEDLERSYYHPVLQRAIPLVEAIALYVWHSKHHLAHIRLVTDKQREEKDKKNRRKKDEKEKKSERSSGQKANPKRALPSDDEVPMLSKWHEKVPNYVSSDTPPDKGGAKRTMTDEQKARMAEGRERARAARSGAAVKVPTLEPVEMEKPKRQMTDEQKARMATGRERARAAKSGAAVEAPTLEPVEMEKPKRQMTDEQKARMAAGRERAKAAKSGAAVEVTPTAPAEIKKPKRQMTDEQKARIAAGRERAKSGKVATLKTV